MSEFENIDRKVAPIVLLLPVDESLDEKVDPQFLLPENFEPLNNTALDALVEIGAAISTVPNGNNVSLQVEEGKRYWLLVVARGKSPSPARTLSRDEFAGLSGYFLPVDGIFRNGPSHLSVLSVQGEQMTVGPVKFQ
ncbi:MAG: hypothetical protein R3C03_02660 [Pirellulaceae bacterium]